MDQPFLPPSDKADSSFSFNPSILSNSPKYSSADYILDITKYIPVGCLRLQRSECGISSDVWKSCNTWCTFAHPRDVYNSGGGPYLLNALQEILFNSNILQHYRGLHNAGWIRMEFKMRDQQFGQIRVYVLPDDVGRSSIERFGSSLRRSMQLLLSQLDISKATWIGNWHQDIPLAHVDASLDDVQAKDDTSLFHLFNTLPSPNPDPESVTDPYAKDAMSRILESDIEGLTTKMHPYQRRSAAMMLQREAQPPQIIDPRLRNIKDQNGITWYCDPDAGSCFREPRTYEAAKGGICAETMGLGKTLICLALILSTRELSSQIPVEYSVDSIPVRKTTGSLVNMCASTIGRTGTPWKKHFARLEAEGYDYSPCVEAIRRGAGFYYLPSPAPRRESRNLVVIPPRKIYLTTATIVIVPPNLVKQWCHEIQKHTTGIKLLVMNELKKRLPPAAELAEYDLILFSKQRFDKEAKDGSDEKGRRQTTSSNFCRCPYIGDTRRRDCTCFRPDGVYHSPLKELHFKRLITDEGHTFGNSSNSSRTEGIAVVDFLQLSARWIVSGTPTQGLYGAEVVMTGREGFVGINNPPLGPLDIIDEPSLDSNESSDTTSSCSEHSSEISIQKEKEFYKQERKDLEKLGNIATMYLKARPWANTREDDDLASWSHHVMQPRHGSKSRGNMDCLRATLEGMIIRHRAEDIITEVTLPPLHQKIVHIEGSLLDKLSLNMFSMMITSNAVTSERKDADYLFHPRQRKALQQLVSNLRQASFFWSGYSSEDVKATIDIAEKFLENKDVPVTPDDELLLRQAIEAGAAVLSSKISKAICQWHEMPMYIYNDYPADILAAWSLDGESENPTLMGATMVHASQKFVGSQLWKEDPMAGLVAHGRASMHAALLAREPAAKNFPSKKNGKDSKLVRKANEEPPPLAGGVKVGDESSPRKRSRSSSVGLKSVKMNASGTAVASKDSIIVHPSGLNSPTLQEQIPQPSSGEVNEAASFAPKLKSALKKSQRTDVAGTLDPLSPLNSATIVSTASAKLSYLMDRIIAHQAQEKILVFYEADNVAYYIAQALECLQIKHLIYAKTLSTARRSQYVVTFNQSPVFRVLLMDVSQAAFGLDMSSASRVYFINPVFSPQVEAQAVKRAHRIGQTKPVFVETLVLKGSIEEVILERRKDMSNEEHNKCKNILDDQTMYDWIRNVRFLHTPINDISGPDQMARLETPQSVFGRGAGSAGETTHDPDADLVNDDPSPKANGKKRSLQRVKTKATFAEDVAETSISDKPTGKRRDLEGETENQFTWKKIRPSVRLGFSGGAQSPNSSQAASPASMSGEDDEIEYETPRKRIRKTIYDTNRQESPSSILNSRGSPTPRLKLKGRSSMAYDDGGSSMNEGGSGLVETKPREPLLVKSPAGPSAGSVMSVNDESMPSKNFYEEMMEMGYRLGPQGWYRPRPSQQEDIESGRALQPEDDIGFVFDAYAGI